MALERQSPTVIVNLGFILEAFTIASLSPVALIDKPSLVPKNPLKSTLTIITITATRISLYQPFLTNISTAPAPM